MSNDNFFIRYLYSIKNESSGKLAALRRACGQRLGESRNCQDFASISTRSVDFLTVTLVAQYPTDRIRKDQHKHEYPHRGSIGAAWARYCRKRDPEKKDPNTFYRKRQEALAKGYDPPRPPNIHERFRTLLDADLEMDGTGELAYRLRGLVRMLVAEDIPIDVIQLARDMRGWRAESRYVQERWAKAFYGPPYGVAGQTGESDTQTKAQDEQEEIFEKEEDDHVN